MEEYYKWQIEQLKATIAKQEAIINQLIGKKLQEIEEAK